MSELFTDTVFDSLYEQAQGLGAVPTVEGYILDEQNRFIDLIVHTDGERAAGSCALTVVDLGIQAVNARIVRLTGDEPPRVLVGQSRVSSEAALSPHDRYLQVMLGIVMGEVVDEQRIVKYCGQVGTYLDTFVAYDQNS